MRDIYGGRNICIYLCVYLRFIILIYVNAPVVTKRCISLCKFTEHRKQFVRTLTWLEAT